MVVNMPYVFIRMLQYSHNGTYNYYSVLLMRKWQEVKSWPGVMRLLSGAAGMLAQLSGSGTCGVTTTVHCLSMSPINCGNRIHAHVKNSENAKSRGNSPRLTLSLSICEASLIDLLF